MKVALVYDRVNKWGGAERVLLSLHKIYPNAPLFTLVYNPQTASWAKDFKVIPSFLNQIAFFRSRHQYLSPIAALAFEMFNFDAFDLVISVSSEQAKSVITKPSTLHICYCLTPTRYLWQSKSPAYANDWRLRAIPDCMKNYLRTTDKYLSNRPDRYIAISNEIKKRIKSMYGHDSDVVYPGIDNRFFTTRLSTKRGDYYLVVSRLVSHKNIEMVINTFNKNKRQLYIVGQGEQFAQLKSVSKTNISFLGRVNDKKLVDIYSKAKALIFPQVEDFGLVALEAQACGTPVIAFAQGGALETVISNKTGIFFHDQTTCSLNEAINQFEQMSPKINPIECRNNAKVFSEAQFIEQFHAKVEQIYETYRHRWRSG